MIIKKDFDLTSYNAYRVKSICSKAFFPEREEDFMDIFSSDNETVKIILGNGNNIILSKEYYESEFVILNGYFDDIEVIDTEINAQAGATLYNLSRIALENSLTGFEIFYDIPSSIGGAVVMNAGTKEGETKDVLTKVRYLDLEDMVIKERNIDNIDFEYRNSFFQKEKNKIVLKSWFNLKKGNKTAIENRMNQIKTRRWEKQPREFPNCGSVFKRPPGKFVGPMLDELGLKGFTLGGAQISEKHSGFIINTGKAKGIDILMLIKEVKKRVKEEFNIELEVEQRII